MHPLNASLIQFAVAVLNILESDKEWSADTTDEISLAAMQNGLAKTGQDGMFEAVELTENK